jgi:uncharacterized protein with GYD domain
MADGEMATSPRRPHFWKEEAMPTYVLLTRLTPDVTKRLKEREKIGRRWKQAVEEKCPDVKWIAHYCLLGPYDFMDIYEAPSEETAAKVSWLTLSMGAVQAESWTAIPYGKFLEIVDGL